MRGQFVSEPIRPDAGTFDTARMAAGEPGLPRRFRWRDRTWQVERVLRTWRETGPCRHGSGEAYVRKHWFEVQVDTGEVLTLYFERTPRRGGCRARWWLYSLKAPGDGRA